VGSTSPYTFYDRDCPDLSPGGCTTAKREVTARDGSAASPPSWFSSLPEATQYQICACIEGSDSSSPTPAATSTVTSVLVASTVVTKPVTVFYTSTATVGGGGTGIVTSYTSVH